MEHIPVLLHETIEGLALREGSKVVDGTAGGGGHSFSICEKIGQSGVLVAIDQDDEAVARVRARLSGVPCRTSVVRGNFRRIEELAHDAGIDSADAILLDIGMSSYQLEDSGRGFSFKNDEPLLMTMDTDAPTTAEQIVNGYEVAELERIFHEYGEEPAARQIAEAIAYARGAEPIRTTQQLVSAIEEGLPSWRRRGRIHPATKVFQALRIAVNDEFGALREGISGGFELLACGGRMAVISFHSLEDRIVKKYFVELAREGVGELVTRKPIVASRAEILENPRSRSAKLRIIEKLHAGNNI